MDLKAETGFMNTQLFYGVVSCSGVGYRQLRYQTMSRKNAEVTVAYLTAVYRKLESRRGVVRQPEPTDRVQTDDIPNSKQDCMQAINITWDAISRNVFRLSRLREMKFPGMYADYQHYVRCNSQDCMQAINITWDAISRSVCRLSWLREMQFPGLYAGYQHYVRCNSQDCMQAIKITWDTISRSVCRLSRLREMQFPELYAGYQVYEALEYEFIFRREKRQIMIKLEDDTIRREMNLTLVTAAPDAGSTLSDYCYSGQFKPGLSPSQRDGSQVAVSTAQTGTRFVWVNFLSIVQSQLCPCALSNHSSVCLHPILCVAAFRLLAICRIFYAAPIVQGDHKSSSRFQNLQRNVQTRQNVRTFKALRYAVKVLHHRAHVHIYNDLYVYCGSMTPNDKQCRECKECKDGIRWTRDWSHIL
jgi:ribosome biogenesis protein Tsr3